MCKGHGIIKTLLLAGMFALLAYMAFAGRDITVETGGDGERRTISVAGTAETFVKPDTASVSFTLIRNAPRTQEAMDSVNRRMGELVGALKSIGVDDEKDIKTVSYNVNPEYSYNDGSRAFVGYRVSQNIRILIRDLEDVNAILETVNRIGVDNVSQLSFFVDEDERIRKDLRKEAIDDAKEKAKVLAKDLSVSLDTIVGYNDNGSNNSQPMYHFDEVANLAKSDGVEAHIPTGENKFVSHVTIIYKIK